MANTENSITELREKKRRRRFYFILAATFLLIYLLFLLAIWFVLRSPIFRIKAINIVGNRQIANEEIKSVFLSRIIQHSFWRSLLGINNILLWPDKLDAEGLIFLPEAKSIGVEKDFSSHSVTINVEERESYGIWCLRPQTNAADMQNNPENQLESASECWWFDKEGVVFKRSVAVKGSLITAINDYSQKKIALNTHILPEKFIDNAFSIFNVLKASGLSIEEVRLNDLSLEELEVLTYPSATLGTGYGPKIYFSLRFSSINNLAVIKDFLSKPGFDNLQYLDFRVQNRVYYK